MSESKIKRADWVRCKGDVGGLVGTVWRMAKDGSWVDVKWRNGEWAWVKRMKLDHLEVLTTIPCGDGYTVTDMTREQEILKNVREV